MEASVVCAELSHDLAGQLTTVQRVENLLGTSSAEHIAQIVTTTIGLGSLHQLLFAVPPLRCVGEMAAEEEALVQQVRDRAERLMGFARFSLCFGEVEL